MISNTPAHMCRQSAMSIARTVHQSGRCIGGLEHKDSRWHYPGTGARILKGAIYALQVNIPARNHTNTKRSDAGNWKLNRRMHNVACIHRNALDFHIHVDRKIRTYRQTDRQTDRHTYRQAYVHTYRQTDRQAYLCLLQPLRGGSMLATGASDGNIRIWNVLTQGSVD